MALIGPIVSVTPEEPMRTKMHATDQPTTTAVGKTAAKIRAVADAAGVGQEAPATPRPAIKEVTRSNIKLLHQVANAWIVYVKEPHAEPRDFDDVHELWTHMTEVFHLYDTLRLVHERWIAQGVVVDCGGGYANVLITHSMALPARRVDADVRVPEGYAIRPGTMDEDSPWIVVRTHDNWRMNKDMSHNRFMDALVWLKRLAIFRDDSVPPIYTTRS